VTIGSLARQAGVRPSAIRYYERLGLLPPPPRHGGRRSYDSDAVARLALVQFALATGFTPPRCEAAGAGCVEGHARLGALA